MLTTAGIILCGGQSTRMGRPKAWLPFGKELLLPRIVRVVSEVVRSVVVVAAHVQALPPLPSEVIIARDTVPNEGPLRGLVTGLAMLLGNCESAFVTACDCPFLQVNFIRMLLGCLENHDAVVPRIAGQVHPLPSVYRLDVLGTAISHLEQGERSMRNLLTHISVRYVREEDCSNFDPALLSLRNVNTPEEYSAALSLLDTQSRQPG